MLRYLNGNLLPYYKREYWHDIGWCDSLLIQFYWMTILFFLVEIWAWEHDTIVLSIDVNFIASFTFFFIFYIHKCIDRLKLLSFLNNRCYEWLSKWVIVVKERRRKNEWGNKKIQEELGITKYIVKFLVYVIIWDKSF